MSPGEARMESCLFCRIAADATAAHVVHESSGAVAFLDAFPAARPHVLVVPRVHAHVQPPTMQALTKLLRAVRWSS